MDDMTLLVTMRASSSERLVLAVEGYLDEDGGMALVRETRAAHDARQRRVRIDLGEVNLFNCSGARQLITLVNHLEQSGCEVDLIDVHPPLQRLLDLST